MTLLDVDYYPDDFYYFEFGAKMHLIKYKCRVQILADIQVQDNHQVEAVKLAVGCKAILVVKLLLN